MAWATPRTWTTGELVTAAMMNQDIRDNMTLAGAPTLGYAQVVANQTGISAVADLTSLAAAVMVATSRRVRISGHGIFQQQTGLGVVTLSIWEGAVQISESDVTAGAANYYVSPETRAVLTPSAGSHTYKLRASTTASTVNLIAATTYPAYILVEDIGT